MPIILSENQALRAGISQEEIDMAKFTGKPRPIPKTAKLPDMKTFIISESKSG